MAKDLPDVFDQGSNNEDGNFQLICGNLCRVQKSPPNGREPVSQFLLQPIVGYSSPYARAMYGILPGATFTRTVTEKLVKADSKAQPCLVIISIASSGDWWWVDEWHHTECITTMRPS